MRDMPWLSRFTWTTPVERAFNFQIWFTKSIGISISNPPSCCKFFVETALLEKNKSGQINLRYDESMGYEDVMRFESIRELETHLLDLTAQLRRKGHLS